jgi:hypothetical protein
MNNERTQTTWAVVRPVRRLGRIILCMRASFLHLNTVCGFVLKYLTMLVQALGATTEGVFRAKLDKRPIRVLQ